MNCVTFFFSLFSRHLYMSFNHLKKFILFTLCLTLLVLNFSMRTIIFLDCYHTKKTFVTCFCTFYHIFLQISSTFMNKWLLDHFLYFLYSMWVYLSFSRVYYHIFYTITVKHPPLDIVWYFTILFSTLSKYFYQDFYFLGHFLFFTLSTQ